jgi:MFS family permease
MSLAVGRPAPRPSTRAPVLFYGWVMVVTLGVTEMIAYGILGYAFPVFLAPMEADLGWTRTELTGAFSVAALVAGVAAIPVGWWVDRFGARGVMSAGSALAAVLLMGWSRVDTLWGFYALWCGLGLASAAVLYEPAFALVANWFVRLRGRALTLLTFLGGFASVVFVPLTAWLVEALGWREALWWLAMIMLGTFPLHALLLRRHPADLGLEPDGGRRGVAGPERRSTAALPHLSAAGAVEAVKSRSFRWLAAAFALSTLATTAAAVHLIPMLLERGYPPTGAGAVLGAVGLMALPGRLIFTPLGSRWPRHLVTASIFAFQAAGFLALLLGSGSLAIWTFVVLFGAGFGAITPARAALLAEFYGAVRYASIGGVLALILSIARAAAPIGGSLLYVRSGGYVPVFGALMIACLLSAFCVVHAYRSASISTQDQRPVAT